MSKIAPVVLANGARAAMMKVTGTINKWPLERMNITNLEELRCKGLRLDIIKFSVQSGMTLHMWWEGEGQEYYICPFEGRGLFEYDWIGGEHSPKKRSNLQIAAEGAGEKRFALWLDMTKVED